ncbi:MAG: CotH kinase family protein [Eubacteriales bacterium]
MRVKKKWLIRIALTGILFLLFSGSASAVVQRTLYAGCPSRCEARVTARWKDDTMVLSLPGCWDLTRITLELDNAETLLLGDGQVRAVPGEPVDLTGMTDRKIEVKNELGYARGYLLVMQGSEIPALFLEVDGKQLSRINSSKKNVITEGRAVYEEADGAVSYDGALEQLKCRGNNTFVYAKKPYQLKLAEKTSLSGMGKGKTWVLLANWADVSLLRNQIVLDLSREAGLKYTVGCVQADVWINGVYNGLYLMTEKIQVGKGRIDITNLEKATEKVNPEPFAPGQMRSETTAGLSKLRSYPSVADPEDITGGYIFTVEKYARFRDYMVPGFRTKNGLSVRIKEPTCPSRGQAEYLGDLVSEMQQAAMTPEGINPMTGKSYGEYLDEDSFARKLLIEDFCKNYDLAGGSQYFYKDSDRTDPLVYAGPSWDYDLSFGNMKDRGTAADTPYVTVYRNKANLYWLLYQHKAFRELAGQTWQRDFRPAVEVLLGTREAEPDGMIRSLDEYKERIAASARMNTKRWGTGSNATNKEAGVSFDHAVEYLRNWIAGRAAWMNGYYTAEQAADGD